MPKTKKQKKQSFEEIKKDIGEQKTMLFIDFSGIKVEDIFTLRKQLKKAGNKLKVEKKTLIQLGLKESGLKADIKKMKGEIALVFGFKDELSPAKIVYEFSKNNPNLKILGGFFENSFKEADDFIVLAQLPSREELLSRLVYSISAPTTNFVRALQYNIKGLVQVLSKIKTKA